MKYLRRSWAVIDLDNLKHNVETVRAGLKHNVRLMCVVKADAYGHGDQFVAPELERLGADWFGVSNLDEGISIRHAGTVAPVLIFGPTPADRVSDLFANKLTQSVHTVEYGRELAAAAAALGVTINVHIKIDTGMARLGFMLDNGGWERSAHDIAWLKREFPSLNTSGIFTHLACADEPAKDSVKYTRRQISQFASFTNQLADAGLGFELRHCCNSAGTSLYPEGHFDMVRPGISLYGLSYDGAAETANANGLLPVMNLYSAVTMVKEIPAGAAVSYGRIYRAARPTKVATVPIGYADGFGRELSGRARMLVRGESAEVIGRVCMDQLMLDVTHIPDVKAGDLVTIVGRDGNNCLDFDGMAALSGTIGYEKVCLIGRRVPRLYRRGGKEIGVLDYINGGQL